MGSRHDSVAPAATPATLPRLAGYDGRAHVDEAPAADRARTRMSGLPGLRLFLARLALFAVPLAVGLGLYLHYSAEIIRREFDPGEAERIAKSFDGAARRTYAWLVLGNSRMYVGVNPDKLSVAAYNFAFDNDSYNQFYYKLAYLDARRVSYDVVVVGVDYFAFGFLSDLRNYAYKNYLGEAYLRDYARDAARFYVTSLFRPVDDDAFNRIMNERFTMVLPLLGEYAFVTLTGRPKTWNRGFVKHNGQRVFQGHVSARDGDTVSPGTRLHVRLPIQERYFEATIARAKQRGARVVLVMPPTRENELRAYPPGVLTEFEAWLAATARAHGVPYLRYAGRPEFATVDFADITHLTESGADKFSALLNVDLLELGLGRSAASP